MTTYLGKSCSFCLPRVPFVNCRQFMHLVISLLVLRADRIWDRIVSVPDHCLSFYFTQQVACNTNLQNCSIGSNSTCKWICLCDPITQRQTNDQTIKNYVKMFNVSTFDFAKSN